MYSKYILNFNLFVLPSLCDNSIVCLHSVTLFYRFLRWSNTTNNFTMLDAESDFLSTCASQVLDQVGPELLGVFCANLFWGRVSSSIGSNWPVIDLMLGSGGFLRTLTDSFRQSTTPSSNRSFRYYAFEQDSGLVRETLADHKKRLRVLGKEEVTIYRTDWIQKRFSDSSYFLSHTLDSDDEIIPTNFNRETLERFFPPERSNLELTDEMRSAFRTLRATQDREWVDDGFVRRHKFKRKEVKLVDLYDGNFDISGTKSSLELLLGQEGEYKSQGPSVSVSVIYGQPYSAQAAKIASPLLLLSEEQHFSRLLSESFHRSSLGQLCRGTVSSGLGSFILIDGTSPLSVEWEIIERFCHPRMVFINNVNLPQHAGWIRARLLEKNSTTWKEGLSGSYEDRWTTILGDEVGRRIMGTRLWTVLVRSSKDFG